MDSITTFVTGLYINFSVEHYYYVCMYVCMHVHMYIRTCIHTYRLKIFACMYVTWSPVYSSQLPNLQMYHLGTLSNCSMKPTLEKGLKVLKNR